MEITREFNEIYTIRIKCWNLYILILLSSREALINIGPNCTFEFNNKKTQSFISP